MDSSICKNCIVPVEFQRAVPAVTCLTQQLKPNTKFEANIGKLLCGKWVSGVTQSFFESTLHMLSVFEGWVAVSDWLDVHEYFYTAANNRTVCTSLLIAETGLCASHVEKVEVCQQEVRIQGRPYDAQLTVTNEVLVSADELPVTVIPSFVKIKKCKSFAVHNWTFTFAMVWSGLTRLCAEKQQESGDVCYEIKVELTDGGDYIKTRTASYVATSILMKVSAIFDSILPFMYIEK